MTTSTHAIRTARYSAVLAASFFALAAVGQAASASEAPATGSAQAGAAKSATCLACHGLNGNSVNPEWPNLAGQNAAYIAGQLRHFRGGSRVNALMSPMAAALTDQDILDLGAHFAVQTPTGGESDPANWQAGQTLYRNGDAARGIPACMACHGPVGRGVPAAGYPALRAQHAVYTVKQLTDYAADTRYTKDEQGKSRGTANGAMMQVIAQRLTDEDRRALASYLQGLR
jgi:cytochrome c553